MIELLFHYFSLYIYVSNLIVAISSKVIYAATYLRTVVDRELCCGECCLLGDPVGRSPYWGLLVNLPEA